MLIQYNTQKVNSDTMQLFSIIFISIHFHVSLHRNCLWLLQCIHYQRMQVSYTVDSLFSLGKLDCAKTQMNCLGSICMQYPSWHFPMTVKFLALGGGEVARVVKYIIVSATEIVSFEKQTTNF